MEKLSYFHFVLIWSNVLAGLSISGMNRNPYKHFIPPAGVNFDRGAHAYDVRIQTIMVSVKSITRHYWTTEWEIEAATTAKETTSNLKRKNFRWDNVMVQHLINSLLENNRLMTYKKFRFRCRQAYAI